MNTAYVPKLTELKAKKRKFGFAMNGIGMHSFIFMGEVMKFLQSVPDDEYLAEMVGYGSSHDFRLYTDIEDLAKTIRTRFAE